jgi:hypothetical protein
MFTGWYELIRSKISKGPNEFVSADVHIFKDPGGTGTYEMLSRERTAKSPEPVISPITPLSFAAMTKSGRETPDYFGREARYKSPSRSFSAPKPPVGYGRDWDPSSTYAAPAQPYVDPLAMHKV